MQLYLDELRSEAGYGFGPGDPAGLGDEGTCDVGPNRGLDGLVEAICLWRNGPFVLLVGGPIDPAVIRDIAEGMDDRAG